MVTLSSEAATVDLEINCGSTFLRDVVVQESGSPKNLTGHTIRAAIRKKFNGVLVADLTVANGKIVETDLVNGSFRILISATETATYNLNKAIDTFVWDLEIEDTSSIVTRYFEGDVEIRPEVTT